MPFMTALVTAAALLGPGAGEAKAAAFIFDSITGQDFAQGTADPYLPVAVSFTTGASPVDLTSVALVLDLGGASGGSFSVNLLEDNNGPGPGGIIAQIGTGLDSQLAVGSPQTLPFYPTTPPTLKAGKRYWIELVGQNGSTVEWWLSQYVSGYGFGFEGEYNYDTVYGTHLNTKQAMFLMQVNPRACAAGDISLNPPWTYVTNAIVITFQDQYGLGAVQALRLKNCTMEGQAYGADDTLLADFTGLSDTAITPLPSGTVKVVCIASRTDPSKPGSCNAQVSDMCATFSASADPLTTQLEIASGGQTQQTLTGMPSMERLIRVQNGTPGLTNLILVANGKSYVLDPLRDGASVSVDVGAAMLPGNANTIVLIGEGPTGGSATIAIGDAAVADPMFVAQPVALQIQSSAQGVQLSWPSSASGYVLQSRSSLAPSGAWLSVPGAPGWVNGRWVVTVPVTGAGQFFRLATP